MKVMRVRGVDVGNDDPGKANSIWLQSTTPVVTPYGTTIVTMMVIHPNDDDLSKITVGDTFKRGDSMFREGTDAGAGQVATHFHISVGVGEIKESTHGLGEHQRKYLSPNLGSIDILVLDTTGKPLLVNEAFYIDNTFTTINNSRNYEFTSL